MEIKLETITKTRESKIEILRELLEKKSREFNTEKKFNKKGMKKLMIEKINQKVQ